MRTQITTHAAILALLLCLGAGGAIAADPQGATVADAGAADLACTHSGNCVNSIVPDGLAPLTFTGPPTRGLELLLATLKTFPEATIEQSTPLGLTVIFTTTLGFKDQVDFRIDPQAQRIDFRSRSLLGLYDFGKNRSRMREFSRRFEQASRS